MAAIVCHGLQSCLESQLAESRLHMLRLPSPKQLTPQPLDLDFKSCFWESNTKPHCEENNYKTETFHHNPISSNPNQGGWSFIQALSNVSHGPKEQLDKETSYVHPQVKQSSLRLSPKSLELCTENLGNETGTDIVESGIGLFSMEIRDQSTSRQVLGAKKAKTQNFPPPLTTIRGSESLRVTPHREGGRLVIEVTKAPSRASCFQSERSHGRLRLCFWTDQEEDDNEGLEEEFESQTNGQRKDVEEEEAEEEEEEEEEEEVEEVVDAENDDSERDTCARGDCMSTEKYVRSRSRRSRRKSSCKEGDNENNELLINWGEPLWVATS